MGLYPKAAAYYQALVGIPRGPLSNVYIVDPVNGSDSNPGTTFEAPLLTLLAAYNKCTTNQNDAVLLVGGPTGNALAAALDWAKSYTHLIGLSGDIPGVGQRARVTGSAALDLTYLVDFQGNGCIVKNVQFFNGGDANADAGAVIVSGSDNHFSNVFFAGMGHATPAARAGSYSLKVTGSENTFERFTIGLDTIVRAAANAELIVSGGRNRFFDGELRSNSVTAGKFLVTIDNSADMRDVQFNNVLFLNYSTNWATGITDAINIPAGGSTVFCILDEKCRFVGVGMGVANNVTHVYGAGAAPNAGFGIALNPTT